MNEQIDYCPAKSIADLPITSILHMPCPDMTGMENPDPQKLERSRFLLEELREKHGIKKRVKNQAKPLNYVCTKDRCLEPWDMNNRTPSRTKIVDVPDKEWRKRLTVQMNQLPNRIIKRNQNEAA